MADLILLGNELCRCVVHDVARRGVGFRTALVERSGVEGGIQLSFNPEFEVEAGIEIGAGIVNWNVGGEVGRESGGHRPIDE
jgi:hypothetical protein